MLFTGNLAKIDFFAATGTAQARAKMFVIDNPRVRKQDGTWANGEAVKVNVVAWGPLAEHVAKSLKVGQRVMVEGRPTTSEYKGADGSTLRGFEIVATDVGASLRWATAEVTKVETTTASSDPVATALAELKRLHDAGVLDDDAYASGVAQVASNAATPKAEKTKGKKSKKAKRALGGEEPF